MFSQYKLNYTHNRSGAEPLQIIIFEIIERKETTTKAKSNEKCAFLITNSIKRD